MLRLPEVTRDGSTLLKLFENENEKIKKQDDQIYFHTLSGFKAFGYRVGFQILKHKSYVPNLVRSIT